MPSRKLKSIMALRHRNAMKVAVLLIGQCNEGPKADPDETKTLFEKLKGKIKLLPPDDGTFQNLATASESEWNAGEFKAARWELVQLARKLRTSMKGFEDGGGAVSAKLVTPQTPTPASSAAVAAT